MFDKLKNMAGFHKETGFMGVVKNINIEEDTVKLWNIYLDEDDSEHEEYGEFKVDDVIFLEKITTVGEMSVFEDDLFFNESTGATLIINKVDEKHFRMSYFDLNNWVKDEEKYNLYEINPEPFKHEVYENSHNSLRMLQNMTLLGNLHMMKYEEEKTLDFNIKVVKNVNTSEYMYACNNKDEEVIDLIKVIFIGHGLQEEDYSRESLSYGEFIKMMDKEDLVEVTFQEFQNFAYNAVMTVSEPLYNQMDCGENCGCAEDECLFDDDDDDECNNEICNGCGEELDYCECVSEAPRKSCGCDCDCND